MKKILITGACGQIGSELTTLLRERYGAENVIASDIKTEPSEDISDTGPYEILDVRDRESLKKVVEKYSIDTIYHMAAILSATGEKNPQLAWDVNVNGLYNVLELAREKKLTRIFVPSSIAAFGPETPKKNTPQDTILKPRTIYGITKVINERLGEYYFWKYGLDVRGVRYPGIISYKTLPGGGTTDYAVEIFYEAIKHKKYTSFLKKDTRLPMMYMPDCLKATVTLMEADISRLRYHTDYNVASMSFSVEELANEIKKHIPDFQIDYKSDFRQEIADSWPESIDDTPAREDWNWSPDYDLSEMTVDMLDKISKKLSSS